MKSESSHEIESVFEDCEDNEQFWSEEEGSDVENQLFNTVIFVSKFTTIFYRSHKPFKFYGYIIQHKVNSNSVNEE